MHDGIQMNYSLISYPLSILLLIFTTFYLLYVFMGLWRKDSPAAQQITYDKEASKSALNALHDDLPAYTPAMIMTSVFYYLSLVGVLVVALLALEIDGK